MPAKISCSKNHPTKKITIHEAAIAVSESRPIGMCGKCGQELLYRVDHPAALDGEGALSSFIVTRAVRLGTRMAGGESYDPFLLVLKNVDTGREEILPTFWSPGADVVRGGQLPPVLTLEEWKAMFRALGTDFRSQEERIRERAYALYEERGGRHGNALQDWLTAEGEIAEPRKMRAAA